MKVLVPSCDPPEVSRGFNYYRQKLMIEISDNCPVCGGPRGRPHPATAYDGSIRMTVDGWENPCGHVDKYEDVIEEAKRLRDEQLPSETH